MGTFGTDISENDLYMDLENEFFELYNQGFDVRTITQKIIEKHNESVESDEDSNNFWLAIAEFQWQCKSLNDKILSKVVKIIDSKSDLKLWRELDSSEEDILDRENKLNQFLKKISNPKKGTKKRITKKLYNSIFKKGDLVIYILENGNYGGAIVVHEENQTEFGFNWLVISDINTKSIPTFKDFKNAKVQYRLENDFDKTHSYPLILGLYGSYYQKNTDNDIKIEVIKNLKVNENKIEEPDWYLGKWNNLSKRIPTEIASTEKIKDWLILKKWWN